MVLPSHMKGLDTLRGVAVLMVFAYHFLFVCNAARGYLLHALFVVSRPGWLGVDLFFVLSGFLITGILADARDLPPARFFKRFYARRALRILPLYYLVLALFSVTLIGRGKVSGGYVLLSTVYLSNVAVILSFPAAPALGVLWSLAVEEHFYIVWPFVFRLFKRRTLLVLLPVLMVLEPLARALAVSMFHPRGAAIAVATWFRLDGLLCGAFLALLVRRPRTSRRTMAFWEWGMTGCAAVLLVFALLPGSPPPQSPFGWAVRYSTAALGFGSILVFFVLREVAGPRERFIEAPLIYLGKRSYCIYLIHVFIIQSFDKLILMAGRTPLTLAGSAVMSLALRASVVVVLTVLASEASFRWYESRFLALKRRFEYHAPPAQRNRQQVKRPATDCVNVV